MYDWLHGSRIKLHGSKIQCKLLIGKNIKLLPYVAVFISRSIFPKSLGTSPKTSMWNDKILKYQEINGLIKYTKSSNCTIKLNHTT